MEVYNVFLIMKLLLFLLALSVPPQNQKTEVKVPPPEPTVVTVSAEAQPVSVAPASITVITGPEIRESGAVDVADLLRFVPGLTVTRVGGQGGLATVSMRGNEPNFTLILIDGIPVNDLTGQLGGAFDFSTLGIEGIAQIEIIRGPLSSLYGSEAAGGVINIVLKRGESKPSAYLSAAGGNFGAARVIGSSSGKVGRFGYAAAASYQDVDDQLGASLERSSLTTTSDFSLGGSHVIHLTGRYSDTSTAGFPGNGGGPEYAILPDLRTDDAHELVVGADYNQQMSSAWLFGVSTDVFHRDLDSYVPPILDTLPPGPLSQPSTAGTSKFTRFRTSVTGGWRPLDHLSADFGFQFRRETGDSDVVYADVIPGGFQFDRNTSALNGQLNYRTDRLTASAGLRVDKPENFRGVTSGRLGLNYRLLPHDIRFKTTWSQGFKLPSFYALAEPNVGNPNLLPETNTGFDIGLERVTAGNGPGFSVTFFRNSFNDLIDFSPEMFKLINRSQVLARGVETSINKTFGPSLLLSGHVTYLDLKAIGSDEQLRDRPKWQGGIGLRWRPTLRSLVELNTLWMGRRVDYELPVPQFDTVGGYSTTSLLVSQRLTHEFELFFRADNLLDDKYLEFVGFRNPGIEWMGGLRVRLGR